MDSARSAIQVTWQREGACVSYQQLHREDESKKKGGAPVSTFVGIFFKVVQRFLGQVCHFLQISLSTSDLGETDTKKLVRR